MWAQYLPHVKTVPEPPPINGDEALLRPRDNMGPSALRVASHTTNPTRKVRLLSIRDTVPPFFLLLILPYFDYYLSTLPNLFWDKNLT